MLLNFRFFSHRTLVALRWVVLTSTLFTSVFAFAEGSVCRTVLTKHPSQYETLLKTIFQTQEFVSIKENPHRQQNASYIVNFPETSVKAILKKVAHRDFLSETNPLPIGKRGAIAEESVYTINQRMGFNSYPVTVRRTITELDPIHQLHPNIENGEYIVSLFLEGYRNITMKEYDYLNSDSDHYGQRRHENPSYVRAQIFEWIAGDYDGHDFMYNPLTNKFASIDGTQSFMQKTVEPFILYGQIEFNRFHYLNDKDFFDSLLPLDPSKIFAGLQKQKEVVGTPYNLNYSAAQKRLLQLQNQIHELKN